jgi:hypothetical protein
MGKKVSECCDQWDDLQTMALADKMDIDAFKPSLNNCSSLDDYELKIRNCIDDNIEACKADAGELDPNNTMQLMVLAALSNINIDKLVNVIKSFYAPQIRVLSLESRINKLYKKIVESKQMTNERETTPAHDGEVAAMDIAMKFKKDDLNIDSDVDVKNKKDAWILRLVYNDGNKENLSMVKPSDDKDDYVITSDKDKLKVKFTDDNELNVPQSVIDHIAKHIEQAEKNIDDKKKENDSQLAHEIAYDIKKEFPNYDMDVIEGDVGDNKWTIEIVYKDGKKDHFTINKLGKNYIMRSKDFFIAKFTLDELKNFPKKLSDHIKAHADKAEKK